MPRQQIREIMDELTNLGGMTPAHMVLITELVAVCLAAGPKPQTSTERVRAFRERENAKRETFHVSCDAVDNNYINNNTTTPLKRRNVSRGTRLPDDWHPSENLWSWGKEKLPESELRFETAAFRDYWAAKAGAGGCKLDWDKTWKTWIRESVRRKLRFKPKSNVVDFVSSGPKRTWQEIKAEKEQS